MGPLSFLDRKLLGKCHSTGLGWYILPTLEALVEVVFERFLKRIFKHLPFPIFKVASRELQVRFQPRKEG